MELERFHCPNCGSGEFKKTADGGYRCAYCGGRFSDIAVQRSVDDIRTACGDTLNAILLAKREEEIAAVRSNLYGAVHAEFLDTEKIVGLCRELKRLKPNDFQAEFYEVASGNNISAINEFVSEMNADNEGVVDYVLEYLIKLISSGTLIVIDDLIRRAYEKTNISKYNAWQEKYQTEAQKIEASVYDVTCTRDVFIAYKSEDMAHVTELVNYLEMQEGLSCFVAARNLQHGRAVDYDGKIKQALDNCRAVVFVSSRNARKTGDARDKELPYIRAQDFDNGPKEWKARSDYKGLPKKYKKPRVEYVVEEYVNLAAEKPIAEFFDGYERCYNVRAVAESLVEQFQTAAAENARSERAMTDADEIKQQQQQLEAKLKKLEKNAASGEATIGSMLVRAENALFRDNNTAKALFNKVLNCDVENGRAWWGLLRLEFDIRDIDEYICSLHYSAYFNMVDSVNWENFVRYASNEPECDEFLRKLRGRVEEFEQEFNEKKTRLENERISQKSQLDKANERLEAARVKVQKGTSKLLDKRILIGAVVVPAVLGAVLWAALGLVVAITVGVLSLAAALTVTILMLVKNDKAYYSRLGGTATIDRIEPEIQRLETNLNNASADLELVIDVIKNCCAMIDLLEALKKSAVTLSGEKPRILMGGSDYVTTPKARVIELKCKNGEYVSPGYPAIALAIPDKPIVISSPIAGSVALSKKPAADGVFVKSGEKIGRCGISNDGRYESRDLTAPTDMLIIKRNDKYGVEEYAYEDVAYGETLYSGIAVEVVNASDSGFIKYRVVVGDVIHNGDILYDME